MRMTLEGDYAICAAPVGGGLPSIGSILVAPGDPTPPLADFNATCDGL
jgi:hypothetical protein